MLVGELVEELTVILGDRIVELLKAKSLVGGARIGRGGIIEESFDFVGF